jgi:metal-responsive CopG/Arc/MetJ family transcriptional regulator
MNTEKTIPFTMRVNKQWLEEIDNWRRTQQNIPSRAEAIRVLVSATINQKPKEI